MSTNIHILLFLKLGKLAKCSFLRFLGKKAWSGPQLSDQLGKISSSQPRKWRNIESRKTKTLKHRTLHDMSNSNKNGSGAKKRKITASTTGTMRVKVSELGRFVILFFSNAPLTFTLRSRRLCVSSSSSSTGWARPNAQGRRHHGRHQR